jgi:hypothetical protein
MQDQRLSLSIPKEEYAPSTYGDGISLVPKSKQFDQVYRVTRVKLNHIFVTKETRDMVLEAITKGKFFVQIADYTIMVNTITSIEPMPMRDKETWEKHQEMKRRFNES